MNYAAMKRLFLKVFLGFLGLTAVVAIVSVLTAEFGDLQVKILVTCSAISAASICSMACAAFIEKRRFAPLGLAGIGLSIVAAMLLIIGVWAEMRDDVFWKTMITFTVAAVALAYAFLLCLADLGEKHQWLLWAFCASVALLALQIVYAIWGEVQSEAYFRALAVVAIVVGLETLAIPIVLKLQTAPSPRRSRLVLQQVAGGVYEDATGKRYRLEEIDQEREGKGCPFTEQ